MNSYNDNKRGRNNSHNRNGNFKKDNFLSQNKEMHKTTCDKCKQECEVPFKPIEGKPVFCKECFMKNKKF